MHEASTKSQATPVVSVLAAVSLGHLLNDSLQSLIPASYPLLKSSLGLKFGQLGMVTLAFQATASVLQPLVGLAFDRRPRPWALPCGMVLTLAGLLLLSRAATFPAVLAAATLMGVGSSIFHPEASRVAHRAAGPRRGFAQSFFQVGGNCGSALGPLLAALVVLPQGQRSLAWFSSVALIGISVLALVARWQDRNPLPSAAPRHTGGPAHPTLPRRRIAGALLILGVLMFSKFFYLSSIGNYYPFYLMARFQMKPETAQVYLFLFLAATAAGTFAGGPAGDRFGRKRVIWASILGVAPFTLVLPYAGLFATAVLSVLIGLVLASAFSAILVYAQELSPGRVGLVAGLFFGLAFGLGGIGSAALGALADHTSVQFMFRVCAFLPLLGLLTVFLPDLRSNSG